MPARAVEIVRFDSIDERQDRDDLLKCSARMIKYPGLNQFASEAVAYLILMEASNKNSWQLDERSLIHLAKVRSIHRLRSYHPPGDQWFPGPNRPGKMPELHRCWWNWPLCFLIRFPFSVPFSLFWIITIRYILLFWRNDEVFITRYSLSNQKSSNNYPFGYSSFNEIPMKFGDDCRSDYRNLSTARLSRRGFLGKLAWWGLSNPRKTRVSRYEKIGLVKLR